MKARLLVGEKREEPKAAVCPLCGHVLLDGSRYSIQRRAMWHFQRAHGKLTVHPKP